MGIGLVCFMSKSSSSRFIYNNSLLASAMALYSTLQYDQAVQVCFLQTEAIAPPLYWKTNAPFDFDFDQICVGINF